MDSQKLQEIHAFAVQLGKDAGQMLMQAAWSRVENRSATGTNFDAFDEKDSSVDIVTKTDHAVEAFIRDSIEAKYPAHKFIGEETYSAGSSREYFIDASPTWVVDPLDGTVNFTHLFPMFCVSIAFVVDHEPIIGVINAPFLHQLFTSCRGHGAWLNETHRLPLVRDPIPPLPANAPRGCIFSCEWGKDRADGPSGNLMRKVDSFVTMAAENSARDGRGGMVHGVRSLGRTPNKRSATLDLAYTAMGSLDIWWEGGCWEWDVAAGIAILEEAGGLVTTANPPNNPESANIPRVQLGSRLYLAIR
ncbi:Inositol monophosphatase, metal-binding site [Purpureocillium lavendulum]|uniref:Inositol-1-monophosphatase n=1 Tax=Purpureocillium lavendulum TaxID=1247861 RepID=A0AB34G160_9HYPO|nr:Inositol monophosphatase, metal-binding site [Purpureocillium lavendulum]